MRRLILEGRLATVTAYPTMAGLQQNMEYIF
jgi:hypothetical protein